MNEATEDVTATDLWQPGPMLYLRAQGDDHEQLCILRVDVSVLDIPGAVVTDQNAARSFVRFSPAAEGLEMLDEGVVFAKYWTHPDPMDQYRHKGAMCAEVLVPDRIASEYLLGARVACEPAKAAAEKMGTTLAVSVDRAMFFKVCAR